MLIKSFPSELFEQAASVATDKSVMAPAIIFFFMFTPFTVSVTLSILL